MSEGQQNETKPLAWRLRYFMAAAVVLALVVAGVACGKVTGAQAIDAGKWVFGILAGGGAASKAAKRVER